LNAKGGTEKLLITSTKKGKITSRFEMYEEGSQIRRSSKSIACTIVEGVGRKVYQRDYLKFIIYAHSSCDETKEHLELLFETNSLKSKKKFDYFLTEYEKVSRMINKFIQNLRPEAWSLELE